MTSFLFYDIETTGLNPCFDQILEFAAIRTDMSLTEIDRHVLNIRLRPDVVPSPEAVLTHGKGPAAFGSGLCEFEAVTRIHGWVNAPGTVSIGYNSLGFDDAFLRFAFYRNLLPPYTHQFHQGCGRMDLFPMVIAFWLYRPDSLVWPQVDGRTSLTLENLNAANHLTSGRAHDALCDTEAALALARRLTAHQDMWDYLTGGFHKPTDLLRMEKLPVAVEGSDGPHRKGLMISSVLGTERAFQAPVLSLGPSVPYANQMLYLRLDLPELRDTTPDTIADTTWVFRKKAGEPGLLLPPLDRYWACLAPERRTTAEENLRWIGANPELFRRIVQWHRDFRYPTVPDMDVDAALYEKGFLSRPQQEWCRRFHQASLDQRRAVTDRQSDGLLRELAERVLMRNYAHRLLNWSPEKWKAFVRRVHPVWDTDALVDYKGNRRTTPARAAEDMERLKREGRLNAAQQQLMDSLAAYVRETFLQPADP